MESLEKKTIMQLPELKDMTGDEMLLYGTNDNTGRVGVPALKKAVSEGFTNERKTKLDALPDAATLDNKFTGKEDKFTTSTDLAMTAQHELQLTDMAKKRLFIDMWNTACGSHGKYNASTGYFELNGLTDISYSEAMAIYNVGPLTSISGYCVNQRTNIPSSMTTNSTTANVELNGVLFGDDKIEIFNPGITVIYGSSLKNCFCRCPKLRIINCELSVSWADSVSKWVYSFKDIPNLEHINSLSLSISFDFSGCPKLDLHTFTAIVNKATSSKDITLTVHPDVYSKITDETNPNYAQWHPLLALAANKKISFATI